MKHKKKYRIKSKFRFITSLTIMICIISLLCISVFKLNTATALTNVTYENVYISNGDTLWSIANEHKDKDKDIRKAVYELCQLNNIVPEDIQPGMTINVPTNL